jgi:hypothetical protein
MMDLNLIGQRAMRARLALVELLDTVGSDHPETPSQSIGHLRDIRIVPPSGVIIGRVILCPDELTDTHTRNLSGIRYAHIRARKMMAGLNPSSLRPCRPARSAGRSPP